mgnify:FL=1
MKFPKIGLTVAAAAAFIAVSAPATVSASEDGEKVFRKCMACHSVKAGQHRVGPSLAGVVGRKAGSADGYKRYKGLKDADWTWDEAALMSYLEDPSAFTKAKNGARSSMAFKLKDEEEREAVIEYLKEH